MRWEDERYVRVYTRDTAEWIALGWEAQCLLVLLFRKVDRAGIIVVGRTGVRGLAGVVGMPSEIVERALPVLLEDKCVAWAHGGSALLLPNFIEAQSAKASDKARQQAARERARDAAAAPEDVSSRTVTAASRTVTERHATDEARHTASLCAVLSCAVPPSGGLGAEAPAEPPVGMGKAEAVRLAWRVWRAGYAKSRKYGAYVSAPDDGKVMGRIGPHAVVVALEQGPGVVPLAERVEGLLRHWFRAYWADDGRVVPGNPVGYLAGARHPLRNFEVGIPTYGSPWPAVSDSSEPRALRPTQLPALPTEVPPPTTLLAEVTQAIGDVGAGTAQVRRRQ